MKLKDLSVALKELDIPCGAIDLRGGLPDNAYCIDRIGTIWEPKNGRSTIARKAENMIQSFLIVRMRLANTYIGLRRA